jgi:hypothetical protein
MRYTSARTWWQRSVIIKTALLELAYAAGRSGKAIQIRKMVAYETELSYFAKNTLRAQIRNPPGSKLISVQEEDIRADAHIHSRMKFPKRVDLALLQSIYGRQV